MPVIVTPLSSSSLNYCIVHGLWCGEEPCKTTVCVILGVRGDEGAGMIWSAKRPPFLALCAVTTLSSIIAKVPENLLCCLWISFYRLR